MENGHVTAFSLAVLNTSKDEQTGNNSHGGKIIVAPFDGAALDRDLQNASDEKSPAAPARRAENAER